MNFSELFPDEDYRFHMALQRGTTEEFFKPTSANAALMAERRRWLRSEPRVYSACLPECSSLLNECIALALGWRTLSESECAAVMAQPAPAQRCLRLGEIWEPDFLLLHPDATGAFHLLGGCVAFPSSWSLEEKIGKPIEAIHGPVPGLNAQLGRSIHSFLGKLSAGETRLRHNWGLSRSPELNQHPNRALPRLDASVQLNEVWLRVERQALVRLPHTAGILFGIRIEMHPLTELRRDALAAARLVRALRTMRIETAVYKGLASSRERIIDLLERG
ncbi:MAG TPA: heme-dependent oxidative N-demethylase subunit alpha family protein [Methylomirabilota bacterium]|nr:heme-dependent oxidative N-demethylase subunit alpha family protein [Methylomirabilota bacterium]